MDLWIRSQNKEKLILINILAIAEDETGTIIGFGVDSKAKVTLGEYKTKERALKVLNEIHQRIIDLQIVKIAPDAYITIGKKGRSIDCVYQMPKE